VEGIVRVSVIAWIAPVAGCIAFFLTVGMSGPASAQGTPGVPPSTVGLGPEDCYWRGKTADVIVQACTAQLRKDPADAEALVKRGIALGERGDFAPAHADLDAAVAAYIKADNYKLGDAYAARGALFLAQRDFSKAIADYTKAIERQPDEWLRYADRARALFESGDAKVALPDAERARSDSYGFAYPLLLRARVYLALGRRDDAIDDLRRAASVGPPPEANDISKEIRQRMRAGTGGDYTEGAAERELARLGVAVAEFPEPATVAAPLARGHCKAGQAPEEATFAATTLSIEPGDLRVGQPIRVRWTIPARQQDAAKPTYLIVATPSVVRFAGSGFFALGPNAEGPARLIFHREAMRAIVPLHTVLADTSGVIEILPYEAGPLAVEWSVTGFTTCGTWATAPRHAEVGNVAAGAARVVVRNEFADTQPLLTIAAAKGPFAVQVFKSRVEVYDRSTNTLVVDRQGTAPTFSPTGRFLVLQPPEAETFEVIDLAARRVLGRYVAEALAWSHADSFLYVLGSREAWMRLVRTFHGVRTDLSQSSITPAGAQGGDWDYTRARHLLTDGDVETHRAAGGNFGHAWDIWRFKLSTVTATLSLQSDWGGGNTTADPEIIVHDLTARTDPMADEVIRRRYGSRFAAFGEAQQTFAKWDAGEPLWLTAAQVQGGDTAEQRARSPDQYARDLAAATEELVPFTKTVATATGRALGKPGTHGPEIASAIRPRGLKTRLRSSGEDLSWTNVLGAQLDHLPNQTIPNWRPAKSDDELQAVTDELKRLYDPKVAIFTFDRSVENRRYSTPAFFDPSKGPPTESAEDNNEPIAFNLAFPGRDLWRWEIGDDVYWLTQTITSGRNGYRFSFTLLNARRGAQTRFADLLSAARDVHGSGTRSQSDPFEEVSLGDVRTELGSAFGDPSIVGVSGERYLALMTMPLTPRLIVFDLQEWKIACAIPSPIDASTAVSAIMHGDARHVTQINANGAVHVYRCEGGEEILTGAYVDDELVIMNRDGYFEGTEDAAGYVEMTLDGIPGRQLLSQYFGVLRKPGVALETLAGTATLASPRLSARPTLRLLGGARAADGVRLEASSATGLAYVQLYADGRPLRRVALSGANAVMPVTERSRPEVGRITAVAVDANGIVSSPLSINSEPSHAGRGSGKLWGLFVGIDRYPLLPSTCGADGRSPCDLTLAAADARRLAHAVGQSRLYKSKQTTVLVDNEASRSAVLARLGALVESAGSEDTIVVSFAGHGLRDEDALRLVLSSTSLDDLAGTSLAFADVAIHLKSARARVIVLLDVCHAGVSDRLATNDDAVSQLVTASGASMIILSASKGRQLSEEDTIAGGGRFSVTIDNILSKRRSAFDLDANGAISVAELYRGLKSEVVRDTAGRQTPWLSRNLMVGDFDIF
jgi:tetratricopeptide (TPR) repeat protein